MDFIGKKIRKLLRLPLFNKINKEILAIEYCNYMPYKKILQNN